MSAATAGAPGAGTVGDVSAQPTPDTPALPDASLGLALRHRPRRLADVVGQRHATAVLRHALAADRLPRRLLFSGGSGLGKTTLARAAAAALLCDAPVDGDACGGCESCLDVTWPGRTHPDVIEFDAASHGGKDQVRELAGRAATTPIRGRWRVYIIDEAHGLTRDGGSAFLKLLEEPPPHVIFMLATTDPDKMLRTNRGRCVEFELLRPTDEELAGHLSAVAAAEGWSLSPATGRAVLAATDPALGVRGALNTLEKLSDALAWGEDPTDDDLAVLLGVAPASLVDQLVARVDDGDRGGTLSALDQLRARVSDDQIRKALLEWARARFVASCEPGGAEGSELGLWRYETVARTPPGPQHTEILLCRLAAPQLDPTPAALGAHLDEASRLLDRLRAGVKAARAAASDLPPAGQHTGPEPAAADPSAEQAGEEHTDPELADSDAAAAADMGVPPVDRFRAALAAVDGDRDGLAALFAQGEVALTVAADGAVVMQPQTAELAALLRQHRTAIRSAAERAEVSLRIAKPTAAEAVSA